MGCNHWMICQRLRVFKLKIETNTLQGDVKAENYFKQPQPNHRKRFDVKTSLTFLKNRDNHTID